MIPQLPFSETAPLGGSEHTVFNAVPAHPLPAISDSQKASGTAELSGEPSSNRWRIDGWLFWREGSGTLRQSAAGRPASYGASQAGAILRYGLGGDRAPFLYARASSSFVEAGEADLALGAGIKPLARLPVAIFAEARATSSLDSWSLRPAAYAVTELPPIRLAGSIEAEAYAQAGYVGGEFATPFADGHVRAERKLATAEGVDLHVGVGAWGGIQQGTGRMDIGPTASARFAIGEAPVRLSADYRIRTAGDASPDSGLAITLSSGF